MEIDEYYIEELLDDLNDIKQDLEDCKIYSSTIKTAKIFLANLEYQYEEAKRNGTNL